MINMLSIYVVLGALCALCFDILYVKLEMKPATMYERFLWIVSWPFFLVMFVWALWKDDDEEE